MPNETQKNAVYFLDDNGHVWEWSLPNRWLDIVYDEGDEIPEGSGYLCVGLEDVWNVLSEGMFIEMPLDKFLAKYQHVELGLLVGKDEVEDVLNSSKWLMMDLEKLLALPITTEEYHRKDMERIIEQLKNKMNDLDMQISLIRSELS